MLTSMNLQVKNNNKTNRCPQQNALINEIPTDVCVKLFLSKIFEQGNGGKIKCMKSEMLILIVI